MRRVNESERCIRCVSDVDGGGGAGKANIKSNIFEKLQKIVKIFGGFGTQNQLINAFSYIYFPVYLIQCEYSTK